MSGVFDVLSLIPNIIVLDDIKKMDTNKKRIMLRNMMNHRDQLVAKLRADDGKSFTKQTLDWINSLDDSSLDRAIALMQMMTSQMEGM